MPESSGINRTNIKALISQVRHDSDDCMSYLQAASLVSEIIDHELRECANELTEELLTKTIGSGGGGGGGPLVEISPDGSIRVISGALTREK